MIIKNEHPILEYSTDRIAVINPDRDASKADRDGQGGAGLGVSPGSAWSRSSRRCLTAR